MYSKQRAGNDAIAGVLSGQYQGGGSPANAPTPRDTIQQALDEQGKQLAELHQTLNILGERLSIVLGPSLPSEANMKDPREVGTNVIERVRLHSIAIGQASGRLSDLLQRLQL